MLRLLRLLVFGYWDPPTKPKKPAICTGYSDDHGNRYGCDGVASPLCWSQKCRHHCLVRCQCEKAGISVEEAKLLRAHREEQKAMLEALR